MKLVLDTNIVISGLFAPKSNAGKVVEACFNRQYDLILSEELIAEIEQVLFYPKIRKKLKLTDEEIKNYCSLLKFNFKIVSIKSTDVKVPTDSKDNHVLATLVAGEADYLISGDADLLNLHKKYPIISLRNFIDEIFYEQ